MKKISAFARLIKAGWILTREGVLSSLPLKNFIILPNFVFFLFRILAKKNTLKRNRSQNIAKAMHSLGPSYIKLGQFLAMRPDLVGQELAQDLSILQDRVQQFPYEKAIAILEKNLGSNFNELFLSLEPAIAAASMAQVHPAWIINQKGNKQKVAVKIVRPNIRQRFAKDLESFYLAARFLEKFISSTRRLRPVCVIDNLAQTTKLELDLRLEAAALSESHENTKNDSDFYVPQVYWDRTARDVLTMEWIEGTKISSLEELKKQGHDLKNLARIVMQSFLKHSLRDGFFHADMHSGNLFVDKKGRIIALDYGITGRLKHKEQYFLAEILYGFIKRDYYRVAKVHFQAGYVPDHHSIESFAQANRAIGEPIYDQSAHSISMAKLLGLLFEITELFDMQTRPELLLLQKSMVVVEGIARVLDPEFNMWKVAEPIVSDWMLQNMGIAGFKRDLKEAGDALVHSFRQTPEILQKWHKITENYHKNTENGFKLNEESLIILAKIQKKQRFSWIFPLWLIAIGLLWIGFIK